jgi:hypothetical protein
MNISKYSNLFIKQEVLNGSSIQKLKITSEEIEVMKIIKPPD